MLFTDASKHGWVGVLTQGFETEVKGKVLKELHPITYVSGLFQGSQLNWAALTKEAYAIYLSVKKLAFYITDADITLRSDHLPLRKFLQKNTLNDKVNNWAVKLETYRIKFVHIKDKSNVLADTHSRLISIDPDVKLEPDLDAHEFRQYCLEELPKASSYTVNEIITGTVIETYDADITETVTTYSIPLPSFKLCELQESDEKLCLLCPRIKRGHMSDSGYFVDKEDDLLQQRILDNSQQFEPVLLSNSLISTALLLAHDHTDHNGFRRTYAALKQLYYWKGIKKDVLIHSKHCQVCAKQNVKKTKFIKDNFRLGSMPMEVISMNLVSRLSRTSSGHKYALTVICMLTGYMFCISLKTKTAEEIMDKYLTHVAFTFGNSRNILSDNSREFKNGLLEEVTKQLGVKRKIHSPVYRPRLNDALRAFKNF